MLSMTRNRKCFSYLICVGIVSFIGLYGYQWYLENEEFYNPHVGGFNYFLEAEEQSKLGYIVNTPNCTILNISVWDKSLVSVMSPLKSFKPLDCAARKKWTYVEGENLFLNTTNLAEFGLKIDSIDCCYRTVTRVQQNKTNFDKNADLSIRFSDTCEELKGQSTRLTTSEFIHVLCKGKYFPYSSDVLYRQFHALALPIRNENDRRKQNYWDQLHKTAQSFSTKISPSEITPPNVLIIGIDSMSRLSFRRNMIKTKKVLEDIGAVEMLGYTKVGENTFPNSAASLSGYFEEELKKICYFSPETPLDSCPYIWKLFNNANYYTAIIEDAPLIATFNYLKTGFVEQPADYYFRPFMLSLHQLGLTLTYFLDCIGYRTVDELILQYISDLVKTINNQRAPLFTYTWLTNMAHNDVYAAQFGDETYANFIRNLDLSNTVLFFMSDHGYRYGKVRQTFAGFYEDKLPNLWVYLPTILRLKYPRWNASLHINSNRLTSPFDLHKTMQHILQVFTSTTENDSVAKNGDKIERRFGQSFLEEIPYNRGCEEAGIGSSFCACMAPKMLSVNSTELQLAANATLIHINKLLPNVCVNLTLSSISGGAVLEQKEKKFIVDFYTSPGNFLFEATVSVLSNSSKPLDLSSLIVDNEILRMNEFSTDVSCVNDGFIERFCYCSFLKKKV